MKKHIISLFVLTLLFACTSEDDCDRNFNETISIEAGNMYCFPDGGILNITDISHSYCPCNAICIWAGEALATGTWTNADGTVEDVLIHETLNSNNPRWITFKSVTTQGGCQAEIVDFKISVTDKSKLSLRCDKDASVDMNAYENGPEDHIVISDASIIGDCLNLTYSASGCDGNSWIVELYDSGAVAESSPEQRSLRLSLNNLESCLAVFTKTTSFDISSLQINNNNGVILLNLDGFDTQLRYEY